MQTWSVIGCGNMARSICVGMGNQGIHYHFYNPTPLKAQQLVQELGGVAHAGVDTIPFDGIVLLGFKPQQLPAVAAWLASRLGKNAIVVSMLAAVDVALLKQFLKTDRIIRIMPNLPVAYRLGATTFYSEMEPKGLDSVLENLRRTGGMFKLESEQLLELATPYHGSAPALYYWLLEKLQQDLMALGMEATLARDLVTATIQGAAHTAALAPEDFSSLRSRVTSRGGLTAEMIAQLEQSHVASLIKLSMEKAQQRGATLSGEIKDQLKKA